MIPVVVIYFKLYFVVPKSA